jgi:hypothetical protein
MKTIKPVATASAPNVLSADSAPNDIGTPSNRPMLTTSELAEGLKLRPGTLHKRFCMYGHVFGLRPVKLSPGRSGRLLWPADSLEQIAARGQ